MITESSIIATFTSSRGNYRDKIQAVNSLRHLLMDPIAVDTSDNDAYNRVYESVMGYISSQYPFLSDEVQRQIEKKKRRQTRRSLEERQGKLHI